jgi:hypothetical protein
MKFFKFTLNCRGNPERIKNHQVKSTIIIHCQLRRRHCSLLCHNPVPQEPEFFIPQSALSGTLRGKEIKSRVVIYKV